MQRGLSSFRPTEVILTHQRKVQKHEANLSVSNFSGGVKITSIGLKLDRPQLQHWLLFLEHNKSQTTQILLQAYLYLWSMTLLMIQLATPPVQLIFSNAGSSSYGI